MLLFVFNILGVANTASSIKSEAQCTLHSKLEDAFPVKSRRVYEVVYNSFTEWRQANNTCSFSEDIFLAYFKDMTKIYKASTLLTHYSLLRNILNVTYNINLQPYPKVRAFLKKCSEDCQPRKSRIFSEEEIKQFIDKAPDYTYLAIKVGTNTNMLTHVKSINYNY